MRNSHQLKLAIRYFGSLCLSFILCAQGLFAQTKTVTGRVTDSRNEAVIAAGVQQKGGNAGAITDADGRYTISVTQGSTLVFSSIGYATQEVVVGTSSTINVVLQDDVERLEDAVVVGYGTMRRRDLTGSISHVKT